VTGTLGGLCFLAWAGADHLWAAARRRALRSTDAATPAPVAGPGPP
jgi:hypothetical protein